VETQTTDRELIERIMNKDSKALEALYDKYSPVLYTLVKKILNDKAKAEEVLADVFVIIWQKSDLYDHNTHNLYTWLILLSRNKALDLLKRESGLVTEEYDDDYENKVIIPKISPEINPIELSGAIDKIGMINSAMTNLTEAQQYVLSLAYYNGLNEKEIAEKLNIPLPTVKTKLRVVLNSIREQIMKEDNI
jgi:RNA polymerase sigma-70 factor (ECF subfamily)